MKLKIDPEFQNLIPPLKKEEFDQLRQNIKMDGCITPLVAWGNLIIDGHNRYKICTEDPNDQIVFDVHQMNFSSREAAMDWIDRNQTGRRNLSVDDIRLIRGRIYNRMKNQGNRSDLTSGKNCQKLTAPTDTAETVGEEFGVSGRTIRTDAKLAATVEEIQKEQPELERPEVIKKAKAKVKAESKAKAKPKQPPKPKQSNQKEVNAGKGDMDGTVTTWALDFAEMAISQLQRIKENDPQREEALLRVASWIKNNLKNHKE